MAGSAGEAVLDIKTNSGQFFTDIDRAEKRSKDLGQAFKQVSQHVDTFSQSMTGLAPGLDQISTRASKFSSIMSTVGVDVSAAAAGVGVGVAAIGVALFELARRAAEVGAELDDMADKTGQSVPALSRLSNAAKVIGADMGSLTNLLFEFQKRLGEGSPEFADGLKRIGTSIEEVKATNPDNLLELLATRMAGVKDQSELAAASFAIFGKQARDQIAVLKDLARGLELTADLTPWSAEQAAAAEEFEMQLKSLKVHVEALAIAFGRDLITTFRDLHLDELAGLFSALADKIGGVSKAVQILGGQIPLVGQLGSFLGFVDALSKVRDASGYVSAGLRMIRGEMEGVSKATGDATFQAEQFYKRVTAMSRQVQAPTSATPGVSTTEAGASINRAFAVEREAVRTLNTELAESKKQHADLAAEMRKAMAAAVAFDKAMHAYAVKTAAEAAEHLDELARRSEFLSVATVIAGEELDNLTAAFNRFTGGITIAGDVLDHVVIPAFSELPNVVAGATKSLDAAREHTASLGAGFKKVFSGDFKAGFKEMGQSILDMVNPMAILNTAIGNLLSKGISALTGLVSKGFKSLFGAIFHTEEKEVNRTRQAFVDAAGGIDALNRKAQAAGVTLDAFLDAKKVKDYQRAIEDLQRAFEFQQQAMEDLEATVKKYKFSIEELGPALERQNLDKLSQEIYHDWMLLVSAGINVAAVAREMGESINDFVQRAIRSGFEVPEAMRPIIQQMIDLGLLTDEAGNKIIDLQGSGIHFSMTMTQGFQALIAAVDRLTQAIARALHLTGALSAAAAAAAAAAAGIVIPAFPGDSGGGGDNGGTREAAGDYLHLMRPRRFTAGEAGREDVVFGGAGRNLARDVAVELARLQPSATHMGATGSRDVIIKLDSQVLAKAVIDDFHAGGNNQTKFKQLVQRSGS
jgi:predicted  nucleic acid-binding Zn-ribbon protein